MGDLVAGIAFLAIGLATALNVRGLAANMAAGYRRLPWWLRWTVTTTEWGVRLWGAVFFIAGIIFLAMAARDLKG